MEPHSPSKGLVVLVTVPDGPRADTLAQSVIQDRLAACVNRVHRVTSLFHWNDTLERANEELLVFKTHEARFEALCELIRDMHPYEIPEIIALPIVGGDDRYLEWLRKEVRADDE